MKRSGEEMPRRDKLEILADMLRLVRQSKTSLYQASGLSHKLYKSRVALLVGKGFLVMVGNNKKVVYQRTVFGEKLLDDIDSIYERIGLNEYV